MTSNNKDVIDQNKPHKSRFSRLTTPRKLNFSRPMAHRKLNFSRLMSPRKLNFTHPIAPHLFLWLGAVAAVLAIISQTPNYYNEIIDLILTTPMVFLIELPAMLILIYIFYYISGTIWIAIGIPSVFVYFLSLINKYKVYLRGDPFMPSDIILGGEALNIVSSSSIKIGAGSIILLLLIILCCAAIGYFMRFRRPHPAGRLIGGLIAVSLAAAGYFYIYTNDAVYASIPVNKNAFNMVNEYNSKGFILAFLYHTKDLNPGALRPDGYSIKRAQEILAKYDADASGQQSGSAPFKPDVIFLMSEAFWDITQIPSLVFDGEDGIGDPIPVFHSLEETCVTGEFIADVYGGGTDTTEFSVLTGHSIANFDGEVASAFKILIRNATDSIVRTFKNNGYSAVALHPGYPWFYNRHNVYPWLGFDDFISIGAFDEEADKSGNYISDYAMTEKLIELYESYTNPQKDNSGGNNAEDAGADADPFFCYTVSIQNHGPYDAGYMYGNMPKNYLTTPEITLSIKGDYAVTNYVRGVRDADASLGRLTGYFNSINRPVVLVFFGDHLPGLGNNFSAYKELGYPIGYDGGIEEKINIYRGRYLIWANRAALETWPAYETLVTQTHRLSASYLGVYVMECLGLETNAYETLVGHMRGLLPVYHTLFYGAGEEDGASLTEGKPDTAAGIDEEALDEYRIAQYYKLFDEILEEGN